MAVEVFAFNKEERDILAQVIAEFRQRRHSTPLRTTPDPNYQAVEVYVGCPTLTIDPGAGQACDPLTPGADDPGTGIHYDHPGVCEFDIYSIVEPGNDEDGDPDLTPIGGMSQRVYNLSDYYLPAAIYPDEAPGTGGNEIDDEMYPNYMPILKTKGGQWLAIPPPPMISTGRVLETGYWRDNFGTIIVDGGDPGTGEDESTTVWADDTTCFAGGDIPKDSWVTYFGVGGVFWLAAVNPSMTVETNASGTGSGSGASIVASLLGPAVENPRWDTATAYADDDQPLCMGAFMNPVEGEGAITYGRYLVIAPMAGQGSDVRTWPVVCTPATQPNIYAPSLTSPTETPDLIPPDSDLAAVIDWINTNIIPATVGLTDDGEGWPGMIYAIQGLNNSMNAILHVLRGFKFISGYDPL
jgi:hypothetical protein